MDHKTYLVVFFTHCPLSTSLHLCIHSRITRFFCYQDDIFCTHWSEDFFGGGLHCDETSNVIALAYVMTWVSHRTWDFAFSLWQDPNCHSCSLHQNTSLTCDVNFFLTHNKLFLLLIWHILHPLKWRFLGVFHYDETLYLIVLAYIITWISHMTWISFSFTMTKP